MLSLNNLTSSLEELGQLSALAVNPPTMQRQIRVSWNKTDVAFRRQYQNSVYAVYPWWATKEMKGQRTGMEIKMKRMSNYISVIVIVMSYWPGGHHSHLTCTSRASWAYVRSPNSRHPLIANRASLGIVDENLFLKKWAMKLNGESQHVCTHPGGLIDRVCAKSLTCDLSLGLLSRSEKDIRLGRRTRRRALDIYRKL